MICFSFSGCQQGERNQANLLFQAKKLHVCQGGFLDFIKAALEG
jgi:hypothetical protein